MALTDVNSTLKNIAVALSKIIVATKKLGTTLATTIAGIRSSIATIQATTGLIYLGTVSVSAGAITDTTIVAANNAKYRSFQFVFKNIQDSVGNSGLRWRWHSGGSFQTTSYNSVSTGSVSTGPSPFTSVDGTFIRLGVTELSTNADIGSSGVLIASNLASTTAYKPVTGTSFSSDGGVYTTYSIGGYWHGGLGTIDGFQIVTGGGSTLVSGSVDIYGIL